MLAAEGSSTQRVLVMRVLCPWEVEGAIMEEQRGKDKWGQQQQGQKRWHLRPQPRRRMGICQRRPPKGDAEDGLFQNSQRRLGCRLGR